VSLSERAAASNPVGTHGCRSPHATDHCAWHAPGAVKESVWPASAGYPKVARAQASGRRSMQSCLQAALVASNVRDSGLSPAASTILVPGSAGAAEDPEGRGPRAAKVRGRRGGGGQ
jgi:hypothetical protein